MKKFYKTMISRTLFVLVFFCFLLVIATGNTRKSNLVNNVNGVKSIEAIHMVLKYDNRNKELEVRNVLNMEEAAEYGPNMPISFDGEMTAYKATCVGCTGKVSCPPRQDVRNNNVTFEDNTYGTVRILAADPAIPCGTIVQISNLTFSSEPVIGIVLDRGGAIEGNIMDFLVNEFDNMDIIGRQKNVHYEVIRWGW